MKSKTLNHFRKSLGYSPSMTLIKLSVSHVLWSLWSCRHSCEVYLGLSARLSSAGGHSLRSLLSQ